MTSAQFALIAGFLFAAAACAPDNSVAVPATPAHAAPHAMPHVVRMAAKTTPSPTVTPTPEPSPASEPSPKSGRGSRIEPPSALADAGQNTLGTRLIDPSGVYADYSRTVHAPGEPMSVDALPDGERPSVRITVDPATGTVETIERRYVRDAPRRLIRDRSGRLFTWDADARPVAKDGDGVVFEYGAGKGDAGTGRYVVLGPLPAEVGAFVLPSPGWEIEVFDYEAGYILATNDSAVAVVDFQSGAVAELDRFARAKHTFPAWMRGYPAYDSLPQGEFVRTSDGFAVTLPSPFAGLTTDSTVRLLRYRWPQELLSDVTFEFATGPEYAGEGNLSETGYRLSPDGRHVAMTSLVWGENRASELPALTAISILEAGTGKELMRVAGATFPRRSMSYLPVPHPGVWLADSSGLVVSTVRGHQIVTLHGRWLPLPQQLSEGRLLPSPDDPTLFLHDMDTVVDIDGETRVALTASPSDNPGRWWTLWGDTSQELVLHSSPSGHGRQPTYAVMHPAIQRPPFEGALMARFAVEDCLNSQPTVYTGGVGCYPEGTPVTIVRNAFRRHLVRVPAEECSGEVKYGCEWVHVIAEDGSRGWVESGSLRWSGNVLPPGPHRGPAAPEVTTVASGDPGVMMLEWTGGPENATHWQYRLRAVGRKVWGWWTDIPDGAAGTGRHRIGGLPDGSDWAFQIRGFVGDIVGAPSDAAYGEVPRLDTNGIPRLHAAWGYEPQLAEGGRAWRLGVTVVDIPAGMRISVWADAPRLDPMPAFEQYTIVDAESDSSLRLAPRFGAECSRSVEPSPTGRDVGALFDLIVASVRVQIDAPPALTTVTTGDRGVVSLGWFGAPDEVAHWEYRLRGPYPIEGPWREGPWGVWTKVAGSDANTRSHRLSGLPDGTAWGFQVRAMAGSMAGAASPEVLGAPAVLGPDGIPQLGGYPQRAEGGRTWRLADSSTVIDVPADLEVRLFVSEAHGDSAFGISSAATDETVYVNAETGTELATSFGGVVMEPPCNFNPARLDRDLDALFDQVRASIRLRPTAR